MEEDIQYIESDPGRVRAKAYDIVLNGNEIGGGSVRIFQDDIQEMMFKALGFTKEQAYSQFGFLLDCLLYTSCYAEGEYVPVSAYNADRTFRTAV